MPSMQQRLGFHLQEPSYTRWRTWPSHLESLTVGDRFNLSLDHVTWPEHLQSLAFGERFNQSLEHVRLPESLRSLTLGERFNRSLDGVAWPSHLQKLIFGNSVEEFGYSVSLKAWCKGFQKPSARTFKVAKIEILGRGHKKTCKRSSLETQNLKVLADRVPVCPQCYSTAQMAGRSTT